MNTPIVLDTASTILDCLNHYGTTRPEEPAYTFVGHRDVDRQVLNYGELLERARRYAAVLHDAGLSGKNVLLLFPTGLDFIVGFFACAYAGAVAIPANIARNSHHYTRLGQIVADSGAVAVLTVTELKVSIAQGLGNSDSLTFYCEPPASTQTCLHAALPGPERLAFIQYTSGSTGVPKGVMISHGQLIANERAIQSVSRLHEGFIGGGWLPQFHDMGLIGAVLQPIAMGGHYVFMSPLHFLQRPLRWLVLLSQYKAIATAAPNFALELCLQADVDEDTAAQLDLSALQILFCGAEPVSATVLERFERKFARYGLREGAVTPCYGLAEATLIVSGGLPLDGQRVLNVARKALENGKAHTQQETGAELQSLVSCGPVVRHHQIVIVAPDSHTILDEGLTGEVWFSGPSVALGYWANEQASTTVFGATTACGQGPYMRTGDLGFVHDANLYIAGRIKELIILRGRNFYPHDIEATLRSAMPNLRDAHTAVFAVGSGESQQVIAYVEFPRRDKSIAGLDFTSFTRALRAAVLMVHDVRLGDVVYLYQGAIPRTSSGKVQRHLCAIRYIDRSIDQHRQLIHSTRLPTLSCLETIAP
ncbi:fatty acyl-AMP ligase [Pseudomonas yamanorum]